MNTQDLYPNNACQFCEEVKIAFSQVMTQFSMNVNKELKDEIYIESQWAGIFLGNENNEIIISIYKPKGKSRWYPKFYLTAFFGWAKASSLPSLDKSDNKTTYLNELSIHAEDMKETFGSVLRGDFSWGSDFEKWLAFLKNCQRDQDCDLPSYLQLVHEGHIG